MSTNDKFRQIISCEMEHVYGGGRNSCGCSNGSSTDLCDAPDIDHCKTLCCYIRGTKYFQWEDSDPQLCPSSVGSFLSRLNPLVLGAGLIYGETGGAGKIHPY